MRISLDWLGEFVDLPEAGELTERLEMSGFEDVFVENTGPDLSTLRVGRVEACEPHPNADKLRLCSVDLGEGELRPIVCGAPNVAAGQKVAVGVPGTRLPDGTKLSKAKIRGQVSLGMICSRRELGLGEEHDGILELDPEAEVGRPLSEVVSAGPRVLEVGITPNRGDVASLLGLAREVRALFPGPLRLPDCETEESGAPAEEAIRVEIDAPQGCYQYVARVVRGVRVAASPPWLVEHLEASGIRSVNNVVDVTNQVLLEFGQPLHAFDLDALDGAKIRVREALAGERLETLDGQTRTLDAGDLVIADAGRAIALAGVMGGAATEVGRPARTFSSRAHTSSREVCACRRGGMACTAKPPTASSGASIRRESRVLRIARRDCSRNWPEERWRPAASKPGAMPSRSPPRSPLTSSTPIACWAPPTASTRLEAASNAWAWTASPRASRACWELRRRTDTISNFPRI